MGKRIVILSPIKLLIHIESHSFLEGGGGGGGGGSGGFVNRGILPFSVTSGFGGSGLRVGLLLAFDIALNVKVFFKIISG